MSETKNKAKAETTEEENIETAETENDKAAETEQDEEVKKRHEYDARAKKLLSRKEVIANILKYAVKEFKEYSIPEIISCLNGDPEIAV